MNLFRRKKNEEPVPGSTSERLEIPLDLESVGLDRLINMTRNVMWCRENLDAMLEYIQEHRTDGHDCPPFCLPQGIVTFLEKLGKDHLIMLMVVLMKDLELTYAYPEEPAA